MKLVILESPAKIKKIESFLGNDYKCIATFGHFRNLKSLKDIDENFNITYSVSNDKMKYLKPLGKAIKLASEIFLATDADFEGHAIAYHVCDYFKLPVETTKRIIFNEITKEAILDAIENPTTLNMQAVMAQKARQILDLEIGFLVSPILWKYINKNCSLSAGRTQTPGLKIVYDNHKEYMEQNPTFYYKTLANFTAQNLVCELNENFERKEDVVHFLELSKTHEHKFELLPVKDLISKPPLPLITSSIQQLSNNKLNFSPKQTMSILQKLYEAGHITYHRTDTPKYSNEFIGSTSKFIVDQYGDKFVNEDIFKLSNKYGSKKDGEQAAHEAIRVTNINVITIPLESNMQTMYKLIHNHNLKSCMSNSIFEELKLKIDAPKGLYYTYKTQRPKHIGFKIIDYTEVEHYFNYLQALEKTQSLYLNNIGSKIHVSNTKSHLTEATLVSNLESLKIGRPSTYASIVDKLLERGYVKKGDVKGKTVNCENIVLDNEKNILVQKEEIIFQGEKNKLIIETMGIRVCEFLYEYYNELFRFDYTRDMEKELDNIANNESDFIEVCSNFKTHIEKTMKEQLEKLPKKDVVIIDDKYTCVNTKNGLTLVETIVTGDQKSSKFHKVKDNFTYDEIKTNQETLHFDDLVDVNCSDKLLGVYKNNDIILKNGKFGIYVQYNNKNIALSTELKKLKYDEINISHIIDLLDETREEKDQNILKVLNKDISIRTGKFGPYVYYMTAKMKKPKFISLNKIKEMKGNDDFDKLTIDVVKKYL